MLLFFYSQEFAFIADYSPPQLAPE